MSEKKETIKQKKKATSPAVPKTEDEETAGKQNDSIIHPNDLKK